MAPPLVNYLFKLWRFWKFPLEMLMEHSHGFSSIWVLFSGNILEKCKWLPWPVPVLKIFLYIFGTTVDTNHCIELPTVSFAIVVPWQSPVPISYPDKILYSSTIEDRRNSIYAWTLKCWERKGRMGRAKHSSEKGPPMVTEVPFSSLCFAPPIFPFLSQTSRVQA